MRRGRPPKYTDHPLFKLRALLGEAEPITQPELARIIDIPLPTLQSIETGRRGRQGIPYSISLKISLRTGAFWDDAKGQWVFSPAKPRHAPFTFALYQRYRRLMMLTFPKDMRDADRDAIKMRIDVMFDFIPTESWMPLFNKLHSFLDEVRGDLQQANEIEVQRVFLATMDMYSWTKDPDTGQMKTLTRKYLDSDGHMRAYRKRMAKRYAALARIDRLDSEVTICD